MLQYFIPRTNKKIQTLNLCQLKSVCRIDSRHGQLPRTMHAHEDRAELILVTDGQGSFNIDNGHYLAQKGDILFFDCGILHDETAVDGDLATSCLSVANFELEHRPPNSLAGKIYAPLLHLEETAFNDLQTLFDTLIRMAREHEDTKILDALMTTIVLKLDKELQAHGEAPQQQESSLGLEVKTYIDQHYREEITLQSIAKHFHFNPYYLAHAFKDHIGYSPMQYIIRRRIGQAQNLLIGTNDSITNIALNCGYNNSNYFQRVFKTFVGLTPGQYRKDWSKQ